MKFLWCVLLIGVWLREISLTQGRNLPPSDSPALPTDTFEGMRLNPPRFPADAYNEPIFLDANALLIVCYSFRKRHRRDQIEAT
jgi:hypothetical protein